jgi:hypothetical protein
VNKPEILARLGVAKPFWEKVGKRGQIYFPPLSRPE